VWTVLGATDEPCLMFVTNGFVPCSGTPNDDDAADVQPPVAGGADADQTHDQSYLHASYVLRSFLTRALSSGHSWW
jgi:hypothetical protein